MDFGIMFFPADDAPTCTYETVREVTIFADRHHFTSVWTPERHFHQFGGMFPNPSVMSAALASITNNIHIRAGSLISPLHNAIRITEDWAVIDHLSQGRIGISFGSGWNVDDFVIEPDAYHERKELMYAQINEVKTLWAGGSIAKVNGAGRLTEIKLTPKPYQPELPIWITSSGDINTFTRAGSMGANILTHLMSHSVAELSKKIEAYKGARKTSHFDPSGGTITLMLHTFLSRDSAQVREKALTPFSSYLRSAIDLENKSAKGGGTISGGSFCPPFKPEDKILDELIEMSFNRYCNEASLMGTPEKCMRFVAQLEEIGVTEIACLVDFGLDMESLFSSLHLLDELRHTYSDKKHRDIDEIAQELTQGMND
jgi:natural product biosynthesis luciferase-like monooxygenase protein